MTQYSSLEIELPPSSKHKNRLIGYAIALIVVGGFSAAGVVILVTPNRYYGNLQ